MEDRICSNCKEMYMINHTTVSRTEIGQPRSRVFKKCLSCNHEEEIIRFTTKSN